MSPCFFKCQGGRRTFAFGAGGALFFVFFSFFGSEAALLLLNRSANINFKYVRKHMRCKLLLLLGNHVQLSLFSKSISQQTRTQPFKQKHAKHKHPASPTPKPYPLFIPLRPSVVKTFNLFWNRWIFPKKDEEPKTVRCWPFLFVAFPY